MIALIQRVTSAHVEINEEIYSSIGKGLLVLLGVIDGDTEKDAEYISRKISLLRIFEDAAGKMNLSVSDVQGEVLVVSQFTLAADCRKGTRPSFEAAEEPGRAETLYIKVADLLRKEGISPKTGIFSAMMNVHLVNNGPVTILINSRKA